MAKQSLTLFKACVYAIVRKELVDVAGCDSLNLVPCNSTVGQIRFKIALVRKNLSFDFQVSLQGADLHEKVTNCVFVGFFQVHDTFLKFFPFKNLNLQNSNKN